MRTLAFTGVGLLDKETHNHKANYKLMMQFSLLNLMAFTAFVAWLMGVHQTEHDLRLFCIIGTATATVVASMVLALCSPIGDGQLEVKRNSFFVVLFAFSKFVILFTIAVIPTAIATSALGYKGLIRWLGGY